MKWMIASDLHGSAYYCRKMLEAFEREGADRPYNGGYHITEEKNGMVQT